MLETISVREDLHFRPLPRWMGVGIENNAETAQLFTESVFIPGLTRVVRLIPGESGIGCGLFHSGETVSEGRSKESTYVSLAVIIEALSQTARTVLVSAGQLSEKGCLCLAQVREAASLQKLQPGREIEFHVEVVGQCEEGYLIHGQALQGDRQCAKATLLMAKKVGEGNGGTTQEYRI